MSDWVDVEMQTRCLLHSNSHAAAKTIKQISRQASSGMMKRAPARTNSEIRRAYHNSTKQRSKPNINRHYYQKCAEVFQKYDTDMSGHVTLVELKILFKDAGINLPKNDLHAWMLRKQGDAQSVSISEFADCLKSLRIDPFSFDQGNEQSSGAGPTISPYENMMQVQQNVSNFSYRRAASQKPLQTPGGSMVAAMIPQSTSNPAHMIATEIPSEIRKQQRELRNSQSKSKLSENANQNQNQKQKQKQKQKGPAAAAASSTESTSSRLHSQRLQKELEASASSAAVNSFENRRQAQSMRAARSAKARRLQEGLSKAAALSGSIGMVARHLEMEDMKRQREQQFHRTKQTVEWRRVQDSVKRNRLAVYHDRLEVQRAEKQAQAKDDYDNMLEQMQIEAAIEEDLTRQYKDVLKLHTYTKLVDDDPNPERMAELRGRAKYEFVQESKRQAVEDRSRKIGEYTRGRQEEYARTRATLETPTVTVDGVEFDHAQNSSSSDRSLNGNSSSSRDIMQQYADDYKYDDFSDPRIDAPTLTVSDSSTYNTALKKPADRQLVNPSQRRVDDRTTLAPDSSHLRTAVPPSPGAGTFAPALMQPAAARRHFGRTQTQEPTPNQTQSAMTQSSLRDSGGSGGGLFKTGERFGGLKPGSEGAAIDTGMGPQAVSNRLSSPLYSFGKAERQFAMRLDTDSAGAPIARDQASVNARFIED